MIRKKTVYDLGLMGWAMLSAGFFISAYTGNAEPYVSPSQLPGEGAPYLFGGVVGAWLLGAFVVDRLKTRDWKAAGRAAGLTPDSGGLLGKPDLTGRIGGRAVRARTIKRKTGSGGDDGGSNKSTFTVVEADLAAPADDGLILGRAAGGASQGTAEFGDTSVSTETFDDGTWAIGADEASVRDLMTGRVRTAFETLGDVDGMLVGDAAAVLTEGADEATDSRIGGFLAGSIASAIADKLSGDASTVTLETKGMVLDPKRLEQQAEAVAAVADAFEDATAGA